jgi:serine---pyruvate transaminase
MLTMAEPIIHHRHPEFQEILTSINENLNYLFQTAQGVMTPHFIRNGWDGSIGM